MRDLLRRGLAVHHSGILPIIKEVKCLKRMFLQCRVNAHNLAIEHVCTAQLGDRTTLSKISSEGNAIRYLAKPSSG